MADEAGVGTQPVGAEVDRQRRGRLGEDAAAELLRRAGYQILERNVRLGRVELDLFARDGPTLAFVEVKARWGERYGAPEEAVTGGKRRNLVRAATQYLRERDLEAQPWRIDVLALRLRGTRVVQSELFKDAVGEE